MNDSVPINESAAASAAVAAWGADATLVAAEKVAKVADDQIITKLYSPTGVPWAWLHHPLGAAGAPSASRSMFPGMSMANDIGVHLLADDHEGGRERKVELHVKKAGCVVTQGVPRFLYWASRARRDSERFAVFGIPLGMKLWSPKAAAAIPHEATVVVDIEDDDTREQVIRLLHGTGNGLVVKIYKRGAP